MVFLAKKPLSLTVTFYGTGKDFFDLCMRTWPFPNNLLLGFIQVTIEVAFANPGIQGLGDTSSIAIDTISLTLCIKGQV